ncbi:MAG: laccase domain-containing protein, partial [Rhodoferax sp.]|nr:laccase domain-containing protein [Rhodoferax sp.]
MQTPEFDWLVPDWPAPPTVRALCTTRDGGSSLGRYAGLNLGLHVGDAAEAVQANRQRLQAAMGVRAVFLNQVHGVHSAPVDAQAPDAMEADGAITSASDVACTVMVADCLPVLLCDARGRAVAAAHAGWRGLLGSTGQGVLEVAVARMCQQTGAPAQELMAWLGPCIG